LIGFSNGSVANCHSTGVVNGDYDVGGLIGYSSYGSIANCHSTGDVNGDYDHVGGLIGHSSNVSINHCYTPNNVTLTGISSVGGLVGYNYRSSITECYSEATVNGSGNDCGGLVGMNYDGSTITDCYCAGSVFGESYVGGLAGSIIDAMATNCYSTGSVSAPHNVGGFTGYNSGACNDCFWDIETSGQNQSVCGTGKTTTEMMQQATFDPPWNFDTVWGIDDGQIYPYLLALSPVCGDKDHPYPIGDLNYDCRVDFFDFTIFAQHWLECTAPECD